MPLARQALHQRGETIHVASWPWVHEMHQVASRHYAFEGRAFVIAAGTVLRKRDLPADLELLQAIPGDPDTFLQRGGSEIGRASCRERGQISVVVVLLIKKATAG